MKKMFLVLIGLVTLISISIGLSISASAEDAIDSGIFGDLTYEFNKTTGEFVISGEGNMNVSTSQIYPMWSKYVQDVKTVTINNGVTDIDKQAFLGFINMTSITIPDSVTKIGDRAFSYCQSLTSVKIPNSVKSMGSFVFEGCMKLADVEWSENLTTIPNGTFVYCESLKSIKIYDNVTKIDSRAFSSCTNLSTVVFGRSLEIIGRDAFFNCHNLTSVFIPNNVKTIEYGAFSGCPVLATVTVGNGVTTIGARAFNDCENLTKLTLGNGLTSIGEEAFLRTPGLTKIIYLGDDKQWDAIQKGKLWIDASKSYEVEYHTHSWKSVDKDSHRLVCNSCVEELYAHHIWNDGEIKTDDAKKVKVFTCVDCGETKTDVGEKLLEETTNGSETSATSDNTTNGGCSSNLGAGFSVIAIVMGVAVLAIYKKKRI